MISGLISAVILIAVIAAWNNGEYGSVAVGIILILMVLSFGRAVRDDCNAYYNRVQYWKMNGRDRARARIRWEREAMSDERAVHSSDYRYVARPDEVAIVMPGKPTQERVAYLKAKQEQYEVKQKLEIVKRLNMSGALLVCKRCCRAVKSEDVSYWIGEHGDLKYRCPMCNAGNTIYHAMQT